MCIRDSRGPGGPDGNGRTSRRRRSAAPVDVVTGLLLLGIRDLRQVALPLLGLVDDDGAQLVVVAERAAVLLPQEDRRGALHGKGVSDGIPLPRGGLDRVARRPHLVVQTGRVGRLGIKFVRFLVRGVADEPADVDVPGEPVDEMGTRQLVDRGKQSVDHRPDVEVGRRRRPHADELLDGRRRRHGVLLSVLGPTAGHPRAHLF